MQRGKDEKKKTRILVAVIAGVCALAAVAGLLVYFLSDRPHRVDWNDTADRFTDEETGVEYVMCNPLAIKPIAIETDGDGYLAYATDRDMTYYQIRFQEPTQFICDFDGESGSSYVYRNSSLPEITLANFEPISAALYNGSVLSLWLYADDKYLPAEMQGQNPTQDTALVQKIADALVNGEGVEIRDEDISDNVLYHFRLFSQVYPGLYYDVALFEAADGKRYIEDMATFKKVLCPDELEVRVFG